MNETVLNATANLTANLTQAAPGLVEAIGQLPPELWWVLYGTILLLLVVAGVLLFKDE